MARSELEREKYLMRMEAQKSLESQEYQRIKNEELLRALATQYSRDIPQIVTRSLQWIQEGLPIEEARAEALQMLQRANQQTPVSSIPLTETAQYGRSVTNNFIGLSQRDLTEYSFTRLLAASCNLIEEKSLGLEKDVHQQLLKGVDKEDRGKIRGLLVPADIFTGNTRNFVNQRAAYAVGANSTGGFTVATEVSSFIEALRPLSVSLMLGAKVLSGLQGNQQIPVQADTSDVFWVPENGALTQSESTFSALTLTPRTFGIMSKFSRQMLLQSTLDVEMMVRTDFIKGMSQGLDAAIIGGSGTSNQPTGILNNSGCQTYTVSAANGASLSYDDLVNIEALAASANGLSQNFAWVSNSNLRKTLRKTPFQGSGVEGNFIWKEISESMAQAGYDTSIFGKVLGYLWATTNNVPSNFVKGSSSSLNGLVYGDWSNVLVGAWGQLEILSNPYSEDDFSRGRTAIRALQSVDVGVKNPESFVVAKQFS